MYKPNFFYMPPGGRFFQVWRNCDHPSFPQIYQLTCQKSCIASILLQRYQPLRYWEESLKTHGEPNVKCSTLFHASLRYKARFAIYVCAFVEVELITAEKFHQRLLLIFRKCVGFQFNNSYNAKHTVSRVIGIQNGIKKDFSVHSKKWSSHVAKDA